jgi:ribosomal protein S6--L-glutamate ligase
MKIGILSFRPLDQKAAYEELRLKKAAQERGHIARIFRANRFQLVYDRESPWLIYNGKPFPKYDVLLIRPSILSNVELYGALIKQVDMTGVLHFNRSVPILNSKNKIKTMQILDHCAIPIPKTVVLQRPEDLKQAVKNVGGFPLIVKRPFGTFGEGVVIIESMRALQSFLAWKRPMYLLQQYIKYSRGKDIRVFVVNGRVVASMMRSAKKGEFRSNIELGGIGKHVELTDDEIAIALRSVQALDLNYGGVDIMRGKDGPVVLEVNSNPGFKALEALSKVDVAGSLVEYAAELAERHRRFMSQD